MLPKARTRGTDNGTSAWPRGFRPPSFGAASRLGQGHPSMSSEVIEIRIDPEVFQQTLEKKLADLPPLPAVVSRIMAMVNDPRASAEDLNRLISLDQGLASKMLRIVNSAYYGFPKRIGTLTHAVVILGFNTVRNLVLGVSAFGLLPSKASKRGLDRTRFWEHSVATAVAAAIIAKRSQPRNRTLSEQAFIGGLLHDFGEIFLDCYFPVQYALVQAHAIREGVPLIAAEQELLGLDHASIARRIAEIWNFPPALLVSVGGWLDPAEDDQHFESAATVHAADWLAWQCEMGSAEGLALPELSETVRNWLNLGETGLEEIEAELRSEFEKTEGLVLIARAA